MFHQSHHIINREGEEKISSLARLHLLMWSLFSIKIAANECRSEGGGAV